MIVLIGFMGSGKTTVGRLLADRLGLPFTDTDEAIETARGKPVSEIFESDGEAAFRTLERDAVAAALGGNEGVVSIGGGAITDPATCAALGWHTVIFLDVDYQEAMRRIGHDPGRPMLQVADPKALLDERRPVYERLATHAIETGGMSPDEVVDRIIDQAGLQPRRATSPIMVELGDRSYPIFVGADIVADLAELVDISASRRAFVLTHPHLAASAKPLVDSLENAGCGSAVITVEEGESSKAVKVAADLWNKLAKAGANRTDLIAAFGGGVVCDLAGFVASTFHRGMPVLHVPTTLLAQVDAAVGGKTAINLPSGKNLVGTIHQPAAVVCDVASLRSLPHEELRSGLAEVIKYGLISDPSLIDLVESNAAAVMDREEGLLATLVRRSVAIKAAVVSADEREAGRREILNYGHTFGHALEHVGGMRHGEAISVGMMAAAHLSVELGMLPEDAVGAHSRVLEAAGLPTSVELEQGPVLETLKRDKKHRGNLRFVLLERIGSPRIGVEATEQQVASALRKVKVT